MKSFQINESKNETETPVIGKRTRRGNRKSKSGEKCVVSYKFAFYQPLHSLQVLDFTGLGSAENVRKRLQAKCASLCCSMSSSIENFRFLESFYLTLFTSFDFITKLVHSIRPWFIRQTNFVLLFFFNPVQRTIKRSGTFYWCGAAVHNRRHHR